MGRVLIAERCPRLGAELARSAGAAGHVAREVSHEGVLAHAAREPFDHVVLDVAGPDDLKLVQALRAAHPALAVVACGAGDTPALAVEALRSGARSFLRKPFPVSALERALACDAVRPARRPPALLTGDPAMQRCLRLAEAAAASDATVLVTGESGTGKDLLARWIHRWSPRRHQPYAVVGCAALPESAPPWSLLGVAPAGPIPATDGGTVLLDEVGDLAPGLQRSLLRALAEGALPTPDDAGPRPLDVRVLATSRLDLDEAVAAGRFRADLLYRLDVVTIRLPPLRERRGDVSLLAQAFLERFAAEAGVPVPRLGVDALAQLEGGAFRGNVRELENRMRRAVLLAAGSGADAARRSPAPEAAADPVNLRALERRTIERALGACAGNRTLASRQLGISVRTLRNKIRLYGLA